MTRIYKIEKSIQVGMIHYREQLGEPGNDLLRRYYELTVDTQYLLERLMSAEDALKIYAFEDGDDYKVEVLEFNVGHCLFIDDGKKARDYFAQYKKEEPETGSTVCKHGTLTNQHCLLCEEKEESK